ncbi:MAG: asparagine synthase (glutamine-hydrolyzing) [Desulfobacteraceae bacterium]|nr:asparagine synthase (glutamine-hydrolyzing) [Desulfobacteraceae bacterium]
MCGIAGILNLTSKDDVSEDIVLRMISILKHRGPEESGVYYDQDIHMGHSRLGIIGLENGTQPISNQDGSLWIVYNGEVFNYIELRSDLEKRGYEFTTQTDTEVILHLYEEMGSASLSELNGQFAIAIWDSRKKELFLARDRVGICPLYYTFQNGRFMFASEIKALFTDKSVLRQIDLASLKQIFTCWTTIGSRTFFNDIKELCPGHYMVIKDDSISEDQKPYWSLPYYPPELQWKGSQEDTAEKLRELLEDAVRLRLRADVPVGAYLSGGLDSSIITSIIAKKFNNRLKTFSLGFEEKAFDESAYQSEMIKFLGTNHHQTSITNQQVSDYFSDVIWHCEKPLLRTGPVPLFMLSKFVRKNNFKVVLTGEGADEVFGGYNIFKEAKVRAFWARKPHSKFRPLLLERLYPYIFENPGRNRAFLQKFFSVTPEDLLDPLMSHQKRWKNTQRCTTFFNENVLNEVAEIHPVADISACLPEDFGKRDLFSRTQWLEMDMFMSNYLLSSQGDRVAMANSVELRVPFLDHRLIDFAARLPAHWKIYGLDEKYLLKKAFQHQLPQNIIKRAKQPYRAPISQAFLNNDNDKLNNLINENQLADTGIFNPKKVKYLFKKCLIQKHGNVSESENMAIVGILSTQLIHEQFIKGFANFAVQPAKPDKIIRRNRDGKISKFFANA